MSRTSETNVRQIIDTDSTLTVEPFIRAASRIVDKLASCASERNETLTSGQLQDIETWLAAYLYAHRDPQYTSKSTLSASGSFKTLDYLETAKMLDTSGCLDELLSNQRASMVWLGKEPSSQTDYSDRD